MLHGSIRPAAPTRPVLPAFPAAKANVPVSWDLPGGWRAVRGRSGGEWEGEDLRRRRPGSRPPGRGDLPAGRRASGPTAPPVDRRPRRALVRRGPPDPSGARGFLDVHRRDHGFAAAVLAPAGHGGGGRAFGVPRRPVGAVAAD